MCALVLSCLSFCPSLSLSVSLCFCLLSLSLFLSVSVSVSLCLSVVLCVVVLCGVCVCGVLCVWCGVWRGLARRKNLRVWIQNVPVCTGTTRTCGNTCARGCRYTRGTFLNLHTEVFWTDTRGAGGHRQCCLPKICPRVVITCFRGSPQETNGSYPFFSLRTGRESNTLPIPPNIRCA